MIKIFFLFTNIIFVNNIVNCYEKMSDQKLNPDPNCSSNLLHASSMLRYFPNHKFPANGEMKILNNTKEFFCEVPILCGNETELDQNLAEQKLLGPEPVEERPSTEIPTTYPPPPPPLGSEPVEEQLVTENPLTYPQPSPPPSSGFNPVKEQLIIEVTPLLGPPPPPPLETVTVEEQILSETSTTHPPPPSSPPFPLGPIPIEEQLVTETPVTYPPPPPPPPPPRHEIV